MIKSKKINLIITAAILALALVVAIITGIQFSSFRNFETQFNLDRVDETFKFHEFSPKLKGTAGDSNIYAIYGTENTVAVVHKARAAEFATEIATDAKICYVAGETAQLEAAKVTLGADRTYEAQETPGLAYGALVGGYADVAIMRWQDVKELYTAGLKDVVIADFEVEKVPSLLILGGTHPNEPSGQLAATIFLENAQVERGNLYVVTEMNKSAYSHSQPQEATAWYFDFELSDGSIRQFKYGSRATNTVDQWPTPDVYAHSSGQKLSSTEVRNLNRAYPGNPNGTYTEQIAWTITNFVITKDITMVIDLHEASPEYGVNNALVHHQDAGDIWANVELLKCFDMFSAESKTLKSKVTGENPSHSRYPKGKPVIKPSPSAPGLHGLTHRELGDYTGAYVFLLETSNASQGKLHGAFVPELINHEGYTDKFYEYAWRQTLTGNELLEAPAASISERVARHVDAISGLIEGYNFIGATRYSFTYFYPDYLGAVPQSQQIGSLVINNIPSYADIFVEGVATHLQPINN